MSILIAALLILVAGLAITAALGWMAYFAEEDAHAETRLTLRGEVHRRMAAEREAVNRKAQVSWLGGRLS
jgi:hypothetical protein